jgi:hypothetical protein
LTSNVRWVRTEQRHAIVVRVLHHPSAGVCAGCQQPLVQEQGLTGRDELVVVAVQEEERGLPALA